MFPQNQIQEFKEAFTLIDQNRDGFIDIEDLKDMYASLGTDPEDALRNAFAMFDPGNKRYLEEEYIKDLLENMGDNFSAEEIRQTWKEAPIKEGKLDYDAFVNLIKRGNQDI
uniref:Myosin regulatory light chain, smooth muscle n=1 Tax=Schistosoma haematobium TaxID=6185 RepID=A0A095APS3_SCHHA